MLLRPPAPALVSNWCGQASLERCFAAPVLAPAGWLAGRAADAVNVRASWSSHPWLPLSTRQHGPVSADALAPMPQALAYAVLISRLDWPAEARAAALRAHMPACGAGDLPARSACCEREVDGESPDVAMALGACARGQSSAAGEGQGQRVCCGAGDCEAGAVVQVRCCEDECVTGLAYVAARAPACCGSDVEAPGPACSPEQFQASGEADGRPCVVVCVAPCREGSAAGKPAAACSAVRS